MTLAAVPTSARRHTGASLGGRHGWAALEEHGRLGSTNCGFDGDPFESHAGDHVRARANGLAARVLHGWRIVGMKGSPPHAPFLRICHTSYINPTRIASHRITPALPSSTADFPRGAVKRFHLALDVAHGLAEHEACVNPPSLEFPHDRRGLALSPLEALVIVSWARRHLRP
jgi:hypothetical protein